MEICKYFSKIRIRKNKILVLLPILFIVLLFSQVWFELNQTTVRSEDILTLMSLFIIFVPLIVVGKMQLKKNILNLPLIIWGGVILLGVLVTLISPFDSVTKKDAIVNGFRLVLSLSMFFIIVNMPIHANVKMKVTKNTIFLFSLITTGVALLQIAYWAGWLPFQLPQALVTFKEGANTEQGREIFALFIGDTGSHTWSGALAMQALLVWLMAKKRKYDTIKIALFGYFLLLTYILIRISVRNSILGLLVAIIGIEVIKNLKTRGRDNVNIFLK